MDTAMIKIPRDGVYNSLSATSVPIGNRRLVMGKKLKTKIAAPSVGPSAASL
jgi:hypothetical protein